MDPTAGHASGAQSIAAWSSAISLLEPAVAWLVERFRVSRLRACAWLGIGGWLLGLGALASYNVGKDWLLLGMNTFELLDFLTANLLLPLGGFFIAIFTGWWVKDMISRDELAMKAGVGFAVWLFIIRFLAPAAVLIIFVINLAIP